MPTTVDNLPQSSSQTRVDLSSHVADPPSVPKKGEAEAGVLSYEEQRIKELRGRLEALQAIAPLRPLTERAGASGDAVLKFIRGKTTTIGFGLLVRIARLAGVTDRWLLAGGEDPPEHSAERDSALAGFLETSSHFCTPKTIGVLHYLESTGQRGDGAWWGRVAAKLESLFEEIDGASAKRADRTEGAKPTTPRTPDPSAPRVDYKAKPASRTASNAQKLRPRR